MLHLFFHNHINLFAQMCQNVASAAGMECVHATQKCHYIASVSDWPIFLCILYIFFVMASVGVSHRLRCEGFSYVFKAGSSVPRTSVSTAQSRLKYIICGGDKIKNPCTSFAIFVGSVYVYGILA